MNRSPADIFNIVSTGIARRLLPLLLLPGLFSASALLAYAPADGDTVTISGVWSEGLSHTAESGTGRLLVFIAHVEHDSPNLTLQAVTYGGQPMTRVIERVQGTGWSAYTAAFALGDAGISAASGNAFVPTWSSTTARAPSFSSVFLRGVDETTPIGDSDANGLNSTATVSTAPLSTADGDMVIVAGTCGNTGTYSVGNGYTEAIELLMESADGVAGYKTATGVPESPGVTHNSGNRQAVIGFVVRAGTGGPAPPDTIPPSVSFVTPAGGDSLYGTITVEAAASDNGAVSRVGFFLDGLPLDTPDSSAPYSILWDTDLYPDTTHILSAVAFDAGGLQSAAEIIVHLVPPPPPDTIPPSVSFIAPADGDSLLGTVRIEAAASDDRGVESVQFFLDGVPLRSPDATAPYTYLWNTENHPDTAHTLSAVAVDTSGLQSAASILVHLIPPPPPDTIPPSVSIIRPAAGDTLSGSVIIEATATDDRAVSHVEFRLDGVAIGAPDNASPYVALLNTDLYSWATHTLTAVAFDTAGLEASAGITVELVPQPPPSAPPSIVAVHVPAWDVHMGSGTNGNYGDMPVDSIDFNTMTHYVSFAAGISPGGDAMEWNNLVSSRRRPLNDRVHAAGKPVLLTIGGAGSDGSLTAAFSPELRETSINTILSAVRANGYDGIDWDWEPFSRADSANLFPVIRALADSFDQPWWSAVYDPSKKIIQTADINSCCGLGDVWADIAPYIEFFMIMSYDKMGSWTGKTYFDYAPYSRVNGTIVDFSRNGEEMATAQNQAIDLLAAGVDPSKVVVGMDFMAAISTGGSGMPNGGATGPRDVWDTSPSFRIDVKFDAFYQDYLDGAPHQVHFDDTAKAYFLSIDQPDDSADQFISFGGSPGYDSSLYYHLRLARELNLGGVMMWDLSESYLGTGRFPEADYPALERNWLTNQMRARIGTIEPPPDLYPPSVSFTSPVEGDSLFGTITVEAAAADNRAVSHVEFLLDDVPLGTPVSSAPYAVSWDTDLHPDGDYILSAVVFDVTGFQSRADVSVHLIPTPPDTVPPTVSFLVPADGDSLFGRLRIEAEASDNRAVGSVQFFLDGIPLRDPDYSAPYRYFWNTDLHSDTTHILTAVAIDTAGLQSSVDITVHLIPTPPDTIPPTVSFLNPADGDSLQGVVGVEAMADDDRAVSHVVFLLDELILGSPDSSSPYAVLWDTDLHSDTVHTLSAVAFDTAGHQSRVDITVHLISSTPPPAPDTIPPAVSFVTPSDGDSLIGTITVEVAATDNRGVSRVEFFLDGITLGSPDSSAPYSMLWDTDPHSDTLHILSAVAFDSAGLRSGADITVVLLPAPPPPPASDTIPPALTLVTPSDGDSIIGSVTVLATATDDRGVSHVTFLLDSVVLGTPDSSAPYTMEWDTGPFPDGAHKFSAVAFDTSGLSTRMDITLHLISPPPPNTPPAFAGDTIVTSAGTEGQNYSGTIAGDASDAEGDSLTFSKTGGPGWLSVSASGGLSGTPDTGDVGLNSFTVHVEDGNGGSDDAVLAIMVGAAPIAGGGPVSIAGTWTGGVSHGVEAGPGRLLVFMAHVEHDAPNVSLNSVTYGGRPMTKVTEMSQGTGFVSYTAAFILDEAGIAAASGNAFTPGWNVSTARAPSYSSVFLTGVDQGTPVGAFAANGGDAPATVATADLPTSDGDMVMVAATCGNTGTYALNNGFTEAIELAMESADGVAGYKAATGSDETPSATHSNSNRQSIIGFVVRAGDMGPPPPNTPPAFAGDTIYSSNGTEGQNYNGTISGAASDADDDALTFSKTGGPSWLSVAAGGALSGTPGSGDVGLNTLTVRVEDGRTGVDDATLQIMVDAAPISGGPVSFAGTWTGGLSHGAEAGTSRLLVFLAHVEHGDPTISLSSVTYGGRPMTRVIERVQGTGFVAYTAAFILDEAGISAAAGGTFSPGWNASPSRTPAYSSVFLTGVDQNAPIGAMASNGSNNTGTVSTGALSTAAGDMVIVAATCGNSGTYSVNNGFTEAIELSISSADAVAGYKAATGASETPSVTHSNGNRQAIVGFVVREVVISSRTGLIPVVESELTPSVPGSYALAQNHPNPFNPSTAIRYDLPEESAVRLHVYDILGRRVASLVDRIQPAGFYRVDFDGSDLPSGVYFFRFEAGGTLNNSAAFTAMKKMVLLK